MHGDQDSRCRVEPRVGQMEDGTATVCTGGYTEQEGVGSAAAVV